MELEGSFTVRAPRDRVWTFFMDPFALSSCISDPHAIEVVDEDHFKGWVKAGVAFIKGTFTGSATIAERVPPERARIKAHGAGMGSAFDVESTIDLSEAGDETTVRWKAGVVLNGTIATMGARLLKGTIDKKTNEFFENARKKLEVG
jgi:carbon monoxide dehydrogenase subunit G